MTSSQPASSRGLKITPPYGYDEIVPLQRSDRVLLPHGSTPTFCRSINAIAVSEAEFVAASRDYPIVFASADGGLSYAPVAVLGLRNGENLFVDAHGDWDARVYRPAFVRRYPFCVSKVYVDGEPRSDRVVCVARAYLDPQGISLFDVDGKPSSQWQSLQRLLADYEQDLDRTANMCAAFARLGLFSPFTFQVMREGEAALKLEGMFRIDEKKFEALKPANHAALVAKGLMGRIYAHFHSLENFARLFERAVKRSTRGKSTPPA